MKPLLLLSFTCMLAACTNQSGAPRNGRDQPVFRVYDLGGHAPNSPAAGPAVIVWSDGVVAVSATFPRYSPQFRLGRISIDAQERKIERLLTGIPIHIAFAADEWKVRMIFKPRDGGTEVIERDLPMCFIEMVCSDRLAEATRKSWEEIMLDLRQSTQVAEVDENAVKRAKEIWLNQSP